jgi:chorismate-pyruvate lyase
VNPHEELKKLTELFPTGEALIAKAEHVAKALVPEPYQGLLVHTSHMTVTMEQYHHTSVDVRVLARAREGNIYSRKIVLVKSGTDDVVQFGIVRFDFQYVTELVRDEILAGEIPLGRVLINHNVLRHIDLGAVLRITAGPELARILRMEAGGITYGRMATIFCNQQPAVDLLEISVPLA